MINLHVSDAGIPGNVILLPLDTVVVTHWPLVVFWVAAAADPIDIDIPDTSVTRDNPTAISFLKNFLMGVLLFYKIFAVYRSIHDCIKHFA